MWYNLLLVHGQSFSTMHFHLDLQYWLDYIHYWIFWCLCSRFQNSISVFKFQKKVLEHRTEQNTKTFLTPEHRTEQNMKQISTLEHRTEQNTKEKKS